MPIAAPVSAPGIQIVVTAALINRNTAEKPIATRLSVATHGRASRLAVPAR